MGTKVKDAEYNPGLGKVIKNDHHKKEILKEKGLVEIGNDFGGGERQQTHFEKRKEEEKEERWKDPSNFFLN